MGLGKRHTIKLDIKNYLHLIIGDRKIGKTGLIADLAKDIYGDIDKLLIVSVGKEKAYEAIDNAIYEEPQNWQELMDIVDELIKNEDKYDFDIVSFDTIDEIIPMAEEEVMRMHTIAYKETPKSFNSAFGGYGEPRKKLNGLIDELLIKLDKIKGRRCVMLIGHNKVRPIKSKLDIEDYYVVSSNLPFDYFNTFAYKCPIICNIIEDVNVDDGVLKEKARQMYFRDNGFVEAGSRFSEMPIKVPYGAKEYHDAVLSGIKASIDKNTRDEKQSKKTFKEPSIENVKTLDGSIKEVIDKAKSLQESGISQNDIMEVFNSSGYSNPNNIPEIEIAEKIMVELNKLG